MTKNHAKLSASGSSKWLNCAGSIEAESKVPNKSSKYSEEGSLAHELADICLKNKVDASNYIGFDIIYERDEKGMIKSGIITEEMAKFVQEYIDYVLSYETKNSQLYSEYKIDFSNVVPEGFGTMDAVIFDYDTNICHVFDFKYGQGVVVDAVENTQGQLYALGLYNEFKCLDVIKSFKIHIIQPRIFNYSSWDISLNDLIEFGKYASKKANEALAPNAPRTPGFKQCQWCNARHNCFELKKFSEETMLENFENLNNKKVTLKNPNELNDQQLKIILDNKKLIEHFLKSVEDYVYDRVLKGESFEGYKIVEGRSNRKWLDDAERFLQERLGEDAYEKKLIGITAASKRLKKDEIEKLTYKPQGNFELVPFIDKRKEVIRVVDHFDKI